MWKTECSLFHFCFFQKKKSDISARQIDETDEVHVTLRSNTLCITGTQSLIWPKPTYVSKASEAICVNKHVQC